MTESRRIIRVKINDLVRVWRPAPFVRALALATAADSVEIWCEPDGTVMSRYLVRND